MDLTNVAFTSQYNTEKIVQVFDGSFLYGTDTTTRVLSLGNQQVFRIAHGYTRPVFADLFWSLDDTDYYVGGGNFDVTETAFAIAFADSTYVYVMAITATGSPIANGTRIYYKIACSWITDYDTTNPLIDEFDDYPSTYRFNFRSSQQTVMLALEGETSLTTASGSLTNVLGVIPHGLDFTPFCKVYFEAFDGEVWPLNYGGLGNPYLWDIDQVEANAFTDATNLTINAIMKAANGSVRFWYMLFTPVTTLQTQTSSGADFAV